jgi:hypothetical protein
MKSGGLQVADAPLTRQSSAASGKPALSAAEAFWRRRLASARRARTQSTSNARLLVSYVYSGIPRAVPHAENGRVNLLSLRAGTRGKRKLGCVPSPQGGTKNTLRRSNSWIGGSRDSALPIGSTKDSARIQKKRPPAGPAILDRGCSKFKFCRLVGVFV